MAGSTHNRARLFAVLLAFASFAIFTAQAAEPAQKTQAYFEFVRQRLTCPDGGCFDEYLLLDNGLAVRKRLDTPDYKGLPRIEVRKLDATPLFKAAADIASHVPARPDQSNGYYEMFLLQNGTIYTFSTTVQPPASVAALAALIDKTFDTAPTDGTADFYLHEYHQPTAGQTEDTHIFSDGTVISSLFDAQSNALLASRLRAADDATMTRLRRKMHLAMLAPPREMPCPPDSGFAYGHLEIRLEGQLKQFETCAHDDSDATALFRDIISTFPGQFTAQQKAPQ